MASDPEEQERWRRYFEATKDTPAHPFYALLDEYLPASGDAIDLGCGTGRGTRHLLERGLRVTATDVAPEAIAIVQERSAGDPMLRTVVAPFQELALDTYDVVVAAFTLFFLPPRDFDEFWPRVVDAVRPGGLFAGQFLGPNDDWSARGYAVHARADVDRLLERFDVAHLQEVEDDGITAIGEQKHWHLFHVIARKR